MCLLLALSTVGAGLPGVAPKRVLILESFGPNIGPWSRATPALKTELAQQCRAPIEFDEVPLETARSGDAATEAAFAAYLRVLYARRSLDLVIPVGGAAAQFWARQRGTVRPAVPMLIGGIEQRMLRMTPLASNDSAVVVRFDMSPGLDTVLKVLPETTTIAVVLGHSPLEQFWAAQCRQQWQPLTNRIHFMWFNNLSFPEMCRRVAALPPRSVIVYGMVLVDATGVPYEDEAALERLCAVANAPVFGLQEEQLGLGIIGGRLFSGKILGRTAGRMAARMLNGEESGGLPPQVIGFGPPTFDWRQLQRWHISESRLPPGSIVRFRPPSVWQQYRGYIIGALAVMLLQAAMILALMLQRAKRRHAEVMAYNLAGKLITDREDERRRIAGELHDQLGQDLLVITSQAQLSLGQREISPATEKQLTQIAQTAKQALQQTRRMVHNLRPGLLDELGFTKAIRVCADKAAQASGLSLAVDLAEVEGLLPAAFEVNLFRIVQEALNNVLKHARASEVKVTLTLERTRLRLLLEDNGRGFDPSCRQSAAPDKQGIGLREIVERAKIMGGRADIQSRPGHGTRLIVDVPCSSLVKLQASPPNRPSN